MEISDLIGVPFVSRGRDPKTGLDCWGLVMEIGRRMGKDIPDFYVDALDSKQIGVIKDFVEKDWVKADKPEPGAIIGLRLDRCCLPDITQHFGVCIDKIRFCHTMQHVGVIVSRVDHRFFKNIITGYWVWSL